MEWSIALLIIFRIARRNKFRLIVKLIGIGRLFEIWILAFLSVRNLISCSNNSTK